MQVQGERGKGLFFEITFTLSNIAESRPDIIIIRVVVLLSLTLT